MKKIFTLLISVFTLFNFNALAFDPSKLGDVLKDGTTILKQLEEAVDKKPQKKQETAPVEKPAETKSAPVEKPAETKSAQPVPKTESKISERRIKDGTAQGISWKANYDNLKCQDLKASGRRGLENMYDVKVIPKNELLKKKYIFSIEKGKRIISLDFTTKTSKEIVKEKSGSGYKDDASGKIFFHNPQKVIDYNNGNEVCYISDTVFYVQPEPKVNFSGGFWGMMQGNSWVTPYGIYDNGEFLINAPDDGFNKAFTLASENSDLDQFVNAQKAQMAAEAEKLASLRDKTGKWGYKFTMTLDDAEKIPRPPGVDYELHWMNSKGEITSDNSKKDSKYYVSEVYKTFGEHTVTGWTKLKKTLGDKYKLVVKPSIEQTEKFLSKIDWSNPADHLEYLYENTKDPNEPKYILLKSGGCYTFNLFFKCAEFKKFMYVAYLDSSVGKLRLGASKKEEEKYDDL